MKRKKLEARPAISGVISPAKFFRCDAEKTKLNWFCFEFAAEILSHVGEPLRKKLETSGVDRAALAGFCIHYSMKMKPAIVMRASGKGENVRLSFLPIENYFSHLNDEFVDQLLTCVAKAWDELTSMCVMCPTRCISEMNARASMFDDPTYYS